MFLYVIFLIYPLYIHTIYFRNFFFFFFFFFFFNKKKKKKIKTQNNNQKLFPKSSGKPKKYSRKPLNYNYQICTSTETIQKIASQHCPKKTAYIVKPNSQQETSKQKLHYQSLQKPTQHSNQPFQQDVNRNTPIKADLLIDILSYHWLSLTLFCVYCRFTITGYQILRTGV